MMQTFEFCLLICLSAVMPSVHNAENPKVKISNGEKPVYVGDTVTLECSHEGDRSDTTGWRYWWYRNEVKTSPGQKIENITVDQPGMITYQCSVQNDRYTFPYSDRVTLTVLELPSQPILRVLPSTSVWKGDNVTLRCLSKSGLTGTKVTYTFQKRQKSVIQKVCDSQTEYKIYSANQNHTGSYWCEVEEEGKEMDNKKSVTVKLTVKAMRLTLSASPTTSVMVGDSINLTCTCEVKESSDSTLTFSLLRNNVMVKSSSDSAVFDIKQADKSHAGRYKCAAESPGGGKAYSNEIELEVQDKKKHSTWQTSSDVHEKTQEGRV